MKYSQKYRPWLIHLINERIYLSERGYCPELLSIAINLKKLIEFNGYQSDEKLAAFIIRKEREIRLIIPANSALSTQIAVLNQAIEQANQTT